MNSSYIRCILIAFAIIFARGQVSQAIEPLPWVPGSWTLAVLPDTQVYTQHYPAIFTSQTQWLADHESDRNIAFVLHEGDLTQNNNTTEWGRADTSMTILDNAGIGYAMALGNHDLGAGGQAGDRTTLLNDYFPVSRFSSTPTFGGVFESGKMDNSYHLFSAGGEDYVALALEFGPRNEVVTWADGILTQHAGRTAMIVTHAYLYSDATRYDFATKGTSQNWNPHSYPLAAPNDGSANVNDGQQLWDKLVSKHANASMVFNGHVLNDGTGLLTSQGNHGQTVHQMLANYQMNANGGNGYMRLLEFLPDSQAIQVKTYSPYLDQYLTDPANQFILNGSGQEASTILFPADDTKLKSTLPDTAHGWQDSITVCNIYDGSTTYKMYMRFDLDSLTAVVDEATLYLYHQADNMVPGDTEVVDVYGMIDGTAGETTWIEGGDTGTGINWNNAPCNVTGSMTDFTNATSLGSFNVTDGNGWFTFSSQALVDFMKADSNDEITLMFSTATTGLYGSFRSKEWTDSTQHPYMEITTIAPIPGDANLDNVVNDADASILAAHWQQSGAEIGWGDGDFDGNNIVNDADASILAAHWQFGVAENASIPEPSMIVLLGICGVMAIRLRVFFTKHPANTAMILE